MPQYTNPDGYVFSETVCRRLAEMDAAPDFLIMWDNTYGVHHLYAESEKQGRLPDMMALCAAAGHPDRVVYFASTSKMTFAGSGIGALAASKANRDWYLNSYKFQTIGPDKINQLYITSVRFTPRCSISPAAWPEVECSPHAPKPASHQAASGKPFFSKLGYWEWKMP